MKKERIIKKYTYNFYLVIEVPDHVYVFYVYRLYFADKDIYMIRYFYHKIEIIRLFLYSLWYSQLVKKIDVDMTSCDGDM